MRSASDPFSFCANDGSAPQRTGARGLQALPGYRLQQTHSHWVSGSGFLNWSPWWCCGGFWVARAAPNTKQSVPFTASLSVCIWWCC